MAPAKQTVETAFNNVMKSVRQKLEQHGRDQAEYLELRSAAHLELQQKENRRAQQLGEAIRKPSSQDIEALTYQKVLDIIRQDVHMEIARVHNAGQLDDQGLSYLDTALDFVTNTPRLFVNGDPAQGYTTTTTGSAQGFIQELRSKGYATEMRRTYDQAVEPFRPKRKAAGSQAASQPPAPVVAPPRPVVRSSPPVLEDEPEPPPVAHPPVSRSAPPPPSDPSIPIFSSDVEPPPPSDPSFPVVGDPDDSGVSFMGWTPGGPRDAAAVAHEVQEFYNKLGRIKQIAEAADAYCKTPKRNRPDNYYYSNLPDIEYRHPDYFKDIADSADREQKALKRFAEQKTEEVTGTRDFQFTVTDTNQADWETALRNARNGVGNYMRIDEQSGGLTTRPRKFTSVQVMNAFDAVTAPDPTSPQGLDPLDDRLFAHKRWKEAAIAATGLAVTVGGGLALNQTRQPKPKDKDVAVAPEVPGGDVKPGAGGKKEVKPAKPEPKVEFPPIPAADAGDDVAAIPPAAGVKLPPAEGGAKVPPAEGGVKPPAEGAMPPAEGGAKPPVKGVPGAPKGAPMPGAPMPGAPAIPVAPMPGAPAIGVAAAGGEVDPTTLPDDDARRKHFEKFCADRVVSGSPKVVDRGFLEKEGDHFVIPKNIHLECYKVNEQGDALWTLHDPATRNTLIIPPADEKAHYAVVASDKPKNYYIARVNGREMERLLNAKGEAVDYVLPNTHPTHKFLQTGIELFETNRIPGIHLAAGYTAAQVKGDKILDNARNQRPRFEFRLPFNNLTTYVHGGIKADFSNALAVPFSGRGAVVGTPPRRGKRSPGETPRVGGGVMPVAEAGNAEDAFIAAESSTVGSVFVRAEGSVDPNMITGKVGINAAGHFQLDNPANQGLQFHIPITTVAPGMDAGAKPNDNPNGHIVGYMILDPKGVRTSQGFQLGDQPPIQMFSGGAVNNRQANSVDVIIKQYDAGEILQPKGEPYTLNELALAVARWDRVPAQLGDVMQKASRARDHLNRLGSFGQDDDRLVNLGKDDFAAVNWTNLTNPHIAGDALSPTWVDKYKEISEELVKSAVARARETVDAAAAEDDLFKKAKLMGIYRPEDPDPGADDKVKKAIAAKQKTVDRQVQDLIDFATKPVGRTKEVGEPLRKYMNDIWLPREHQLIPNPGAFDKGVDIETPKAKKVSAIRNRHSSVENIADADGPVHANDPNLGRGQHTRDQQLIAAEELGIDPLHVELNRDHMKTFTDRIKQQADLGREQLGKMDSGNKGPKGRWS